MMDIYITASGQQRRERKMLLSYLRALTKYKITSKLKGSYKGGSHLLICSL